MPVAVQNNGPDKMSAHNSSPSRVPVTGGGVKQNLIPANIWYHPSITSQTGGAAAPYRPQTGTKKTGHRGKKSTTPSNVTLTPDQRSHSSDRKKTTPANTTQTPDQRSHSSDRKKTTPDITIWYHPSITSQTGGAAAPYRPQTGTKKTGHRGKKSTTPSNVTLTPDQRSQSSDRKKTTPANTTQTPDQRSHSSDRKKTTPDITTQTPDQRSHSSHSPTSRRRCNDRDAAPPPSPEEVPVGVGVKVEAGVVKQVEALTRGQSENPAWFSWRKNRITASVAHRIAHCRFIQDPAHHSPPASYLNSITGEGPHVQTRAMRWGVEREKVAVRKYQGLKSRALGRDVTVQECGLFIDPGRSWLAASPDGIVTDRQTGQWLLCLEVKCPYKHRERTVEEACMQDAAFCLKMDDRDGQRPMKPPVYHVKQDHSYYSQIQVQLAVTGLTQADLVVYTLRETAIVPVTFDPEWWAETVSKLETFYKDALLPHLRNKQLPTTVEE